MRQIREEIMRERLFNGLMTRLKKKVVEIFKTILASNSDLKKIF